ncbi:uncharacterized protein N7496_009740 [Penicillium cataractarum]|uniref:Uncharacterized protein n=1 Tax=Penicillium cataractarum TaxID=2100454 RepID=A0A9W9RPJ8_9EURO|nr:uncharacterized protein N7496_009740 [Penicillium cataractarum]KAJ5364027.1 hypothetical protein N7496_009740 [Penicillium cataractarum]
MHLSAGARGQAGGLTDLESSKSASNLQVEFANPDEFSKRKQNVSSLILEAGTIPVEEEKENN